MARLGLQFKDSLSLSYTKFKIRRIRTILTLISTSILALVLVVASSFMTGLFKAANSTPQGELVDLHLASTHPEARDTEANPDAAIAEVKTKAKNRDAIKNVYLQL